jgi:hypothetical protein
MVNNPVVVLYVIVYVKEWGDAVFIAVVRAVIILVAV